jgi:predicted amidohydrolase YtcJ
VDAHVHATSTGLLLTGLDLTACSSLAECLDAVRRFAASTDAPLLWGHGWDESGWRSGPRRPPTRAEIDEAVNGQPAYLSRIDVHSALVSSALAEHAAGLPGYSPDGPLSRDAHHAARRAAQAGLSASQRRAAQRAFLRLAASRGIGCVHECAGPYISGVDDLRDLLAAAGGPDGGPDVVGYWGELVSSADQARDVLAGTGAHGLAGDLFADGALGSRTAALRAPYLDAPPSCGAAYLDAAQIADHVVACTQAGIQGGFHVIGDAAVATVVEGFALAADRVGSDALAARTHRLEHLEMVSPAHAAALARHGVLASVQPQFDAAWGGPDGMYAQRLGVDRALAMNPFAALSSAGMALAFGSDTPVTPLDPWATVRAAVYHHTPGSGVPVETAFIAHTVGGAVAAGGRVQGAGMLVPGAVATYAVWAVDGLSAAIEGASPRCVHTVVRGKTIFSGEGARRT